MLVYNLINKIVICQTCKWSIVPVLWSQERHLRAEPHRLFGDTLNTMVQLLSRYEQRTTEELKEHKPRPEDNCELIEFLAYYDNLRCLQPGCQYCTRNSRKMKKHVASIHKIKATEHRRSPLWDACKLQTYFTGHGRLNYFVVIEMPSQSSRSKLDSARLTKTEEELFAKLEKDYDDVKVDIEEQASIVHDVGDSRSERVPWLHDLTGFPYHMYTLKDEGIWSSYKLLPKKGIKASSENTNNLSILGHKDRSSA